MREWKYAYIIYFLLDDPICDCNSMPNRWFSRFTNWLKFTPTPYESLDFNDPIEDWLASISDLKLLK